MGPTQLPSWQLRRTGVFVTGLGFGGAPIGGLHRARTEAEADDAVDAAWAAGIRYFDTAPHYGLGLSERRLGAALAERRRSEFVVSTRVGRLLEPNPRPTGSDLAVGGFVAPDHLRRVPDYSADGVRRSIDDSLRRLGLDHLDIVLVDDQHEHAEQAVREAIPALISLREQGIVGAVGLATKGWQVPVPAGRQADLDVVMIGGRWTLWDRSAAPLLDECLARGVGVLVAMPLHSGPQTATGTPRSARPSDDGAPARRLAAICRDAGVELPEVALQFASRHPATVSVVPGLGSAQDVESAAARFAAEIPAALWAEIDTLVASVRV